MELTPLRSSTGCGACCGYEFGALFLVRLQMTVLVFLSTSAPTAFIPTHLRRGPTVLETEQLLDNTHD